MTEKFRFTHDKLYRIKARDERFIVWDSQHRGLGLRVTPNGTRSFVMTYRFNGKPRMLTMGNTPPLTLEQALQRYADAIKSLAQARQMRLHENETPPVELDPGATKTAARAARRTAESFEDVWKAYRAKLVLRGTRKYGKPHRARTLKEYDRMANSYLLKEFCDWKIIDIRPKDVKALLNKIEEKGPVQANRARELLSAIFRYAKDQFIVESNPVREVRRPTTERPRQRALDTEAELRGFMTAVEAMSCSAPIKAALLMVLATAARPGEVSSMRRSDIDKDAAIWTIRPEVDKIGVGRRVPLSHFAMSLLERADDFVLEKDVVFPSGRWARAISTRTLSRAILDHRELFTEHKVEVFRPHDLRRTARTWLSKLRVSYDIAEMCLGHLVGSAISRIYNVDDRLPEIREALERLGAQLEPMRAGTNVVAMKSAA